MIKLPVYLDHNATTPVDKRVLEVMLPFFTENFGNAASVTHSYGSIAADAVATARKQVAQLIQADPNEITFTSGSTEAINLAIKGVYESYASKGDHIITITTEHNAVLDTCRGLEKKGARVTYLQVNNEGMIDLLQLEEAITQKTILIVVMYANNETGVIHSVKEIGRIAHERGCIFLCDATQAVGKIPVNVMEDNIDLLCLSAHKLYGPKGVGALYKRRKDPRVTLIPQIEGGGHERGLRSGTLNVPGIVGLGKACEIAREEMKTEAQRLTILRDQLEQDLLAHCNAHVNGSREHRLPHVSNMTFITSDATSLIPHLLKIAVSSGSACTAASEEPSHVLKAMGISDNDAKNSIRFSLGRHTTKEEIDFAVGYVKEKLGAKK